MELWRLALLGVESAGEKLEGRFGAKEPTMAPALLTVSVSLNSRRPESMLGTLQLSLLLTEVRIREEDAASCRGEFWFVNDDVFMLAKSDIKDDMLTFKVCPSFTD